MRMNLHRSSIFEFKYTRWKPAMGEFIFELNYCRLPKSDKKRRMVAMLDACSIKRMRAFAHKAHASIS